MIGFSQFEQLWFVLSDMWARRWFGLVAAWIVGVVLAAIVMKVPERWEANSRIYVDTQTIMKPLMQGLTVQPDVDQMVSMLARTLISRPNVERLISNAGLDVDLSADEREQLIETLTKQIKLNNTVGGHNLYDISYRDVNPARAERVVKELVALFVSSGQGEKRHDTQEALKFLDEQIQLYEKKLEEAENRLKQFRLRNFSIVPGTNAGQDYFARMSRVQDDLAAAEIDLRAAEQSRDALKHQLSQEQATLPTAKKNRMSDIDARIEAERHRLYDLLHRYTEEHPDVIAARHMIEQLEAERTQVSSRQDPGPPVEMESKDNSAYAQIKVKLAEAEAIVASLRARRDKITQQLQTLKASAEKVPKVEADLQQLNRDYDVVKQDYEQLVKRRESAIISGDQDSSGGLANFKVINPPRVDPEPVFPSRVALVAFALLGSLAAGMGVCFAVVEMFPTVRSIRELRSITSRAVLGAISLSVDSAAAVQARRWNAVFLPSLIGLVALYAAWAAFIALH